MCEGTGHACHDARGGGLHFQPCLGAVSEGPWPGGNAAWSAGQAQRHRHGIIPQRVGAQIRAV